MIQAGFKIFHEEEKHRTRHKIQQYLSRRNMYKRKQPIPLTTHTHTLNHSMIHTVYSSVNFPKQGLSCLMTPGLSKDIQCHV